MVWFVAGGRDTNHAPVVPGTRWVLHHRDVAAAGKLLAFLSHGAYLSGLGSPDGV